MKCSSPILVMLHLTPSGSYFHNMINWVGNFEIINTGSFGVNQSLFSGSPFFQNQNKQKICIWSDRLNGSLHGFQVRAEAALLVEKYEDLAFHEKEQKEALTLQVCFVTRISDDKLWLLLCSECLWTQWHSRRYSRVSELLHVSCVLL